MKVLNEVTLTVTLVLPAQRASKIDGKTADAIIDALAESGVHSPPEALEQAIKRGDAATVKWLRDNIFVNNDKLRRRAEWFLKRGEQRALWLDVFDLDQLPADPSVLKPNETLDSCTDKDF
nr:hypothetical protein HK105_005668 [Polyrhizophydium stewartii]